MKNYIFISISEFAFLHLFTILQQMLLDGIYYSLQAEQLRLVNCQLEAALYAHM